ncbi:MAG: hypothetical protein ACR2RV_02675, partial [Verrucomicrobiales bacterium]
GRRRSPQSDMDEIEPGGKLRLSLSKSSPASDYLVNRRPFHQPYRMKNIGSVVPKSGYAALIVSAALGMAVGYMIRGGHTDDANLAGTGSQPSSKTESARPAEERGNSPSLSQKLSGSKLTGRPARDRVAESVNEFRQVLTGGKSISNRERFFQMLMDMTPRSAPELAKVFMESEPSRMQLDEEHKMFWQRWGEIDGASACAAIFEADARLSSSLISNAAISAWAEMDPAAARSWLVAQEDIPLRHGMMRGLVEGMARTDIAEVQQFVDEADLSVKEKAHAHWRIARHHLEQSGVDAVGDWYSQFADDDPMIEHVSLTAVDIYTAGSVGESLAWIQQLERGDARTAALDRHVRKNLAEQKPDLVIDYLARHEDLSGLEHSASFASLATDEWIRANPNGMGKWLGENMDIPNYDLVAVPFVRNIVRRDSNAAAHWAETIKDPNLRKSIQEELSTQH